MAFRGLIVFLISSTSLPGAAHAQLAVEIPIRGLPAKAHYCQIVVTQSGAMVSSYDAKQMGSGLPGGMAGYANVSATRSSYRLHLDSPTTFHLSPPGGNSGAIFNATYSGTGDTNFSETPGTIPVKIKKGSTRVATNISVTKSGETFPAGDYATGLTLRCE